MALHLGGLGGAQCASLKQFDGDAFDQYLRRNIIKTFYPTILT
jgi:hypothetical protein